MPPSPFPLSFPASVAITMPNPSAITEVRLAELMAALSTATDLGMGQPMEYAVWACVLAMRLGETLGLDDDELRNVYYQALLRYVGCNAETHVLAAIFGDELALRADFARVDMGHTAEVLNLVLRYIREANRGTPLIGLIRSLAHGLLTVPQTVKVNFTGHCEVAQRFAQRLGFSDSIQAALGQLYERWDGRGLPNGLKGEAIALSVRLVTLAQDMITFYRLEGLEAAVAVAKERRNSAYDPQLVDCFCREAPRLLSGLEDELAWDLLLTLEPRPHNYLSEAQFDNACLTMADFVDIKSPHTLGHSPRVAHLAAQAAQHCGLPQDDVTFIRRAGLLHDLGRVSVPTSIWEKPGAFTNREWERVRMHPYYTERILLRPPKLAQIGGVASLHHERLDGSGYYRGAATLSPLARILAAADAYQRLIESRPHRPAKMPDAAAEALRLEVRAGRLDREAVNSVLAVEGHFIRKMQQEWVAGLSEREIEVLRLVARGYSMKQIAQRLFIAPKTVDNHLQHIYNKIGVSTRAGATLFATENDLLEDSRPE